LSFLARAAAAALVSSSAGLILPAGGALAAVGDITEYAVPTAASHPESIVSGPDGNLWFTEFDGNKIGRVTPSGMFSEYAVPTAASGPAAITSGPDGNLWFTENSIGKIGRITTGGVVTEFPIPTASSYPYGITSGPDGNLWFVEYGSSKIARMTTVGSVTEFQVANHNPGGFGDQLLGITAGPDGNLWFTEGGASMIGRITPSGVLTEYTLPSGNGAHEGITAGPDGNLWFTGGGDVFHAGAIGRVTPAGAITMYPTAIGSVPLGITTGPDGNLWFTESKTNMVAKITPSGVITEYALPTPGGDSLHLGPYGIATGLDGNVWFTEYQQNKVAKIVVGAPTPVSPSQPLNVTALGGEASATVYWSPPASRGTSVVSGYTVTSSPGGITATTSGSVATATVTGLSDGTSYTFTVTATNLAGTGPPSAPSNAVTPGRGQYHSLPPLRILDTRNGTGGVPVAPLGANSSMNAQITGLGGVPISGVAAVILNVTVTNTTAGSYLTVWPTGVPQPLASNLNFVGGVSVPNLVEVAVGINGQVSVYNAYGTTDVIFDVAGYVATPTAVAGPDGLNNPVVPFRLLDTRDGTGLPLGAPAPVGPNQMIAVKVAGVMGSNVPATGVSAVVLNVTVTNPTGGSYLTVFPAGDSKPLVSNLNFFAGQTVPNRVIVKVGTGGQVNIYNAYGTVDVLADVGGWFTDGVTTTTGSRYVGVIPARILDTRDGTGGVSAPVGANAFIPVTVAGRGNVPAMTATTPPSAVVLNVTVTNPTVGGYLTAWPDGASRPLASDLNYGPGVTVPNLVVVKLGSNGMIDLYNAYGSVDVIIDVVGWYG
jgi:streptogramin lyase